MTEQLASREAQALRSLLEALDPGAGPQDLQALVHLVNWLRPDAATRPYRPHGRLPELFALLEADPSLMAHVQAYLARLLSQLRIKHTLAELGILANESLGQTIKARLAQRLLPAQVDEDTFQHVLGVVFHQSEDHVWLTRLPAELQAHCIGPFGAGDLLRPAIRHLRHETLNALDLLSLRVAALGVETEFTRCLNASDLAASPFVEQWMELRTWLNEAQAPETAEAPPANHLEVLLSQCAQMLKKARAQAALQGTSVKLSGILIRLAQSLARMQTLLQLLGAFKLDDRPAQLVHFLAELVRHERHKHSIADVWAQWTDAIALRVTEHASQSAEKYVTETRSEYWQMAKAAMGAGVVIAFLSLFKAKVAAWHVPPLWEAVLFSLNYGLGFVLIHWLHFTIATKQPAMTAARIAAAIDSVDGRLRSLDAVVELVVQVARTQFVAIWGNVIPAFVTATAVAWGVQALWGSSAVALAKSEVMLHELHPVLSWALPHAAIAGVFLFLTGLITGYCDNLSLYHRLSDRLRKVPWLRRWLGVVKAGRLADYMGRNAGALAGNFLFGCMLGSAGFIGLLLGLPIDIRHITFAAANMAYALQAQQYAVLWADVAWVGAGVLLIGLVNLMVSFSLAFYTALKSRGVSRREVFRLVRPLWNRFRRRPMDWVYPSAGEIREGN